MISKSNVVQSLVKEELGAYVRKNVSTCGDCVSDILSTERIILQVSIPNEAFTYRFSTMGGPDFPLAMSQHINRFFNPMLPVEPGHIVTAAALTSIHEMLGHCLGDPGDGILVSRPVYGRFELDFGNTNSLSMVYANCSGIDAFSPAVIPRLQIALDEYALSGGSVKALLIVNPHNPLGKIYLAS